ncbi:MAG: hypothetical protein AABZ74_14180 [Cyanobacteriota bacterium]
MLTLKESQKHEELLSLDVDFTKNVLTLLKKVSISSIEILPILEKKKVQEKIGEYLQKELQDSDISITNLEELSSYLLEYFGAIQHVLNICRDIRKKIGYDSQLRLALDREDSDFSNYAHPVIYVKKDNMSREARKIIRDLPSEFLEPLIQYGIAFGCRPDRLK